MHYQDHLKFNCDKGFLLLGAMAALFLLHPVVAAEPLVAPGLATDSPSDDDHWWDGFGDPSRFGFGYPVRALVEYEGRLIAGGDFVGQPTNAIAAWSDSGWIDLAGGVQQGPNCQGIPDCNAWVEDAVVYRGDLIVGGKFDRAGGFPPAYRADNIARWDGSAWHPLGSGVNGFVWQLTVFNDELVVSGDFTSAGGLSIVRIARWNGFSWLPMGQLNGPVNAFVEYEGDLVASGYFSLAPKQACAKASSRRIHDSALRAFRIAGRWLPQVAILLMVQSVSPFPSSRSGLVTGPRYPGFSDDRSVSQRLDEALCAA